ncbi:hypothetical protein PHLCEN_2v11084 [Hermanssonia centrifuga]|uniref:Uncharacterized protein n=1 Tax=Hermanssonia centrifuga TaxID=98765 RepID=A0A2R6NM21_9APHY|nr:hypothetical protein PHLCEN_2v11084 [Hermanssonia centrifuga]
MNWKTGVVMKPIECIDVALLSGLFVLLSESCFLLGNIKENSNTIEVYSTEDEIATRDSDGAVLPVHIATYHLPPCRKGIRTFIYDSYWSFCSKLSHGIARVTPFEAAPASAMLHISIYYRRPESEHYGFMVLHDLLIPRQVFANVCNIYKMQNVAEPVSHSWESWGPSSTRSIPEGWKIASMYGSRVLINRKHHLRTRRIMDFNQVDIARDLSNRKQPTAGGAISPSGSHLNLEVFSEHAELPDLGVIETEPTIVHDEVLFVDDVVTKLPFRWTKITEGVDWLSAQYGWLNVRQATNICDN